MHNKHDEVWKWNFLGLRYLLVSSTTSLYFIRLSYWTTLIQVLLSIIALVTAIISEAKDQWSKDAADGLNMAEALFGVLLSVISFSYAIRDHEPGRWLMILDIIGVVLFGTSSIVCLITRHYCTLKCLLRDSTNGLSKAGVTTVKMRLQQFVLY